MDPNAVVNRVLRLVRFDTTVFDEVRDDQQELIPALIVLAISSLLGGLGAMLHWEIVPAFDPDSTFVNSLLLGSIFFFVMYIVAALIIYVVLAQMYKVTADMQSLIRTMGYASLPFALCLLMFIPVVWPLFALAPLGLLLVMMIYAVQAASNAESSQVVISTFIGFAVMVLVLGVIALQGDFPDAPIGAGTFGILIDLS